MALRNFRRRHALYDVWLDETGERLLSEVGDWPEILSQIARRHGAVILKQEFHQFDPRGVTGFLLLAESHISLHTWPEEGLAAFDIFACGTLDVEALVADLRAYLHPCRETLRIVERGGPESGNPSF